MTSVTTQVVIDDGAHAGPGRRTELTLTWSPTDPLAVQLQLTAMPEHPALPRGRWVVLRDFLRYGMDEPTGDGTVRIRPDLVRDRVWLELDRYGRPACVSLPRPVLLAFLERTEQAVATGSERSAAALEDLLDRLLQR